MSRYRGPKAKICRRFGENIYGTEKCASILSKKNYAPGQHGKSFSKNVSDYGKQFLMKQKAKFIYGLTERQFRNHYESASKKNGIIGDLFLARLEQRLDNIIYRLGFAVTRSQARQLVSHGMFNVNGIKNNIPSCEIKVGDEISIKSSKVGNGYFKSIEEKIVNYKNVPTWLSLDTKNKKAKMISLPGRDDFDSSIRVQVIVEFYSK